MKAAQRRQRGGQEEVTFHFTPLELEIARERAGGYL